MVIRCSILFVLITSLCGSQISGSRLLRNSPIQQQEYGISSSYNITNYYRRNGVETAGKKQRVVLLAGPHKTSSTSEQFNIIRWINHDKILPGWSWPVPVINENGVCGVNPEAKAKIFYVYIASLINLGKKSCLRKFYGTAKNLTNDYEQEFRNSWRHGSNLIIASEAMDFVGSTRDKYGPHLLRRILLGMPWNSNDDPATRLEGNDDAITVVVNFRAPRVEHLISLWHQCCMDTMSFQEYLTLYLPNHRDKLRSLDSLQLVEVFLERDMQVKLIDMSGAASLGYDTSDVVACDVMGADCTPNKTIVGDIVSPGKMNVKDHYHGGTKAELEMLEKVIRNYDCNFLNITKNKKLTILYPKELTKIFKDCKNIIPVERIFTRDEMVKRLSNIGSAFNSIEDGS